MSNVFNSIRTTTSRIFDNIKNAMFKPVEDARDKISNAIENIKSFFSNLRLKFPKIEMPKLPKFSLDGKFSLNPPSVPKLSVNWNAAGAIFTRPTIFDTPLGLQGVGDVVGGEAVLPIEKLSGIMANIMRELGYGNVETKNEGGNVIVKLYIENFINESDMDIEDLIEKIQFEIERKLKSIGGGTTHALV